MNQDCTDCIVVKPKTRTMVVGLGDWHFNDFCTAIRDAGAEVAACNRVPRLHGSVEGWGHRALELAWNARFRLIGQSPSFYTNPAVYHRLRAFDLYTAGLVRAKDPDVLVAWTGMSKRTLRSARSRGTASLLIQGNSPLDIYEERLCAALGSNLHILPQWKRDQAEEYQQAHRIVVESRYCAEGLLRIGVSAEKVEVLPPHVALTAAAVQPKETVRFCLIQPNRRKGLHLLIDWWRQIKNPPGLSLIGRISPEELPPGPLPAEVEVTGHLRGGEYDDELTRASVLIIPTFEDGGPRALFEGMARGLCVIASEFSAAPDHITNGENGFVLPLHDRDAWIETIKWCQREPERVHDIGKNARKYVAAHLTHEKLGERWAALIQSVRTNV